MISENNRPKIHLKRSSLEILLEIITIVALIAAWYYIIIMWNEIPNIVPTHFNFKGQANSYGNKDSLFILPIISTVIFIIFNILSMFPQILNYPVKITEENAEKQYKNAKLLLMVLMTELSVLFLYIEWGSIHSALTASSGIATVFLPISSLILIVTLAGFIYRMAKFK